MPANRAVLGWVVWYAELLSMFPRSRLWRVVITSAVLVLASKPMMIRNLLSNTRSSLGFGTSTSGFFGGFKTFTSFAADAGTADNNATARIIFFKIFSCPQGKILNARTHVCPIVDILDSACEIAFGYRDLVRVIFWRDRLEGPIAVTGEVL
jgi:hypothetical protein